MPLEELDWPVYQYEIVEAYHGRKWPGGLFLPKGVDPESPPPEKRWPKPVRWYKPLHCAEEILQDVSRLDPSDPKDLLAFVSRWGRLGVGASYPRPKDPATGWWGMYMLADLTDPWGTGQTDGVTNTAEHLGDIKELNEGLYTLQHRRASRYSWPQLAWALDGRLGGVKLSVRPAENRLFPLYRIRRLLDGLYLQLWERATEAHQLRRCRECQSLFVPDRRDQRYCKTNGQQLCARRASLKRFRRRGKRQPGMSPAK